MKILISLVAGLLFIPGYAFASYHVYQSSDWIEPTYSVTFPDTQSVQFQANGNTSIVTDWNAVFPFVEDTTYYVTVNSLCSTGNLQFQSGGGNYHETWACGGSYEFTFTAIGGDSLNFAQLAGGTSNWNSDTNALVNFFCISNTSHDECAYTPPPAPNATTTNSNTIGIQISTSTASVTYDPSQTLFNGLILAMGTIALLTFLLRK